MRSLSWMAAALVAVAACSSKPVEEKPVSTSVAPGPAVAPPPRPAIGDFGLDLTAGKPEVRPGDDFFAHANGKWYDTFQIPADRASFGVFNELDELSKTRVRGIIEQAAASQPSAGSPAQKIGDFYASFMDEAAIEANGLAPAQGDLERIESAATAKDIATLFGLPGFASLFDIDLPPDLKNPDQYSVVISQSAAPTRADSGCPTATTTSRMIRS